MSYAFVYDVMLCRRLVDVGLQSGSSFYPFDTLEDALWGQVTVEQGVGKRKRDALLQIMRHPDFLPQNMKVVTEGRRKVVMQKLPVPVNIQ